MKEKTKKRIKGSITILVIIIMLPMMTMSAIIVDSSRINMARSMVSSAGDLTMNAALANYDTILKDVYGLFAMSQNMTDDELASELKNYFETTLVSYGVTNEADAGDYVDALIGDFKDLIANSKNGKPSNFLDMKIPDFTAKKVSNSSLDNPEIMRKQIVEYMKYRAPLNFGLSFLDSIKSFTAIQSQTEVVEKQVKAQESVQDVSSTCKDAIAAIREYDKLIDSIKKGDKAVKGRNNDGDGQTIDISEYHSQVDKYGSSWSDNYSDINTLNLVFLAKSPDLKSAYLKKLDYKHSEWFIKTNNDGVVYSNSGISVSPSLKSKTNEAKEQFDRQRNKLNNTSGIENKTAKAYNNEKFLPDNCLNAVQNRLTKVTDASNAFIKFEKFYTDNDSSKVKYSDVKTTLEGIYILGKYYDNYKSKIDADITSAENEKKEANEKVGKADSDAGGYYKNVQDNVNYINSENENYKTGYNFLNGIKNSDNEDLKSVVDSILSQNNVTMPTATKSTGNKTFTNFAGFINSNYKEKASDSDYKYLKVFKEIIGSALKNDDNYSKICTAATSYLSDKAAKKTTLTFKDYIKKKAGNSSVNNELFKLLNHLYQNNGYVDAINSNITNYNSIYNDYNSLVQTAKEKTEAYDNKVTERNAAAANYKACLSKYKDFSNRFQRDLYFYDCYKTAAKNTITDKAKKIQKQFSLIKSNIDDIIKKLDTIENKLSAARSAIETYNDNLDKWKSSNDSYASKNSNDSFSQQNNSDISAAKTQYDIKSLDTLNTYVGSIKKEYQDFYDVITDGTHFKYGNKKIYDISKADNVISASSSINESLPSIVTIDTAENKFADLYKSNNTGAIEADPWYFLKPTVLPIQFLRYLNETYPDESTAKKSDTVTVKDGKDGSEIKFNYEDTKKGLKENSGGEVKDDTDTDKFGYSYKDKSISKNDLPSKDIAEKDTSNSQFKVSGKDNGNVDVSSGFSSQSKTLGSLLSGIGDVAMNTLENSYILSYIFNNFSYNTLIQDMAVDGENIDYSDTGGATLTKAMSLMSGDKLNKYVGNSKTLSNYNKNKGNNYFYGAEIEYILYGNTKAAKNVTYAKASIYAIRFAFNCIYAFTNSEIRNTTMSVGLAVQAATLGIVPYQLVQIVLQLALAAGESAFDLSMMNNGLKVAIVKTSDTWMLSISNAVKTAGQLAADKISEVATKTIDTISSGLQSLVDAGADTINKSLKDLSSNITAAAESKVEEIIDSAFSVVQSEIEEKLNKLQFSETDNINAEVDSMFADLESTLSTKLEEKFGEDELASKVLPKINSRISGILDSVKSEIKSQLSNIPSGKSAQEVLASKMTEIKTKIIGVISNAIEAVNDGTANIVNDITNSAKSEITECIKETEKNVDEKLTKSIKEKATNATNSFADKYLNGGSKTIGGGADGVKGSSSSSVASMFKFGYKDYLMLFMFISVSVNDSTVLTRTADVIQMNIQNATTDNGASYQHKLTGVDGKSFEMKNAATYISIKATADLDMLFMNMDFFTNVLKDDNAEVNGQFTPNAKIEYKGLYGY